MSPYAENWKIARKNITKIASTNVSVSVFDRIQEVESAHFLLNLLASPQNLFDHIRKLVTTSCDPRACLRRLMCATAGKLAL
jgi:hypothetical protein